MLYFADVSTVVFFGMFSVVLRGCSVLTSFLLSLQVLFYFLGGVHMLLLLKGWMADQYFLSKLSRDSDSGGYGVTLLGTKTSSCEGLRIFEESLVISFLCSSTSLFLLNCFLYY